MSVNYEDFKITPAYAPTNLVISYDSYLIDENGNSDALPSFIIFNSTDKDWTVNAKT
jgi:hypothetical protein